MTGFLTTSQDNQLQLNKNFCHLPFTKQVVKFKHTPATYILVLMISLEERNKKPYALPVQCLAYVSLGDMAVRRICDVLIKEMDDRGMKVAGMCNTISL